MTGVRHSYHVTVADDPNYPVGSDEWNDQHVIEDGTITAAMLAPGVGGSPLTVTDGTTSIPNVTQLTADGATVSAGGAGEAIVTVPVPSTPDLAAVLAAGNDPGGTAIKGADFGGMVGGSMSATAANIEHGGGVSFQAGSSAAGRGGASLKASGGNDDGEFGGFVQLMGGHISGDFSPASITAEGSQSARSGRLRIATDDSYGALGQVLTAQGDSSAIWDDIPNLPTADEKAALDAAPTALTALNPVASVADLPSVSGAVPVGGIIMWSGSIATIPTPTWQLCDGSANAPGPDLRNTFIVGAYQDDAGVAKTSIEGSLKVSSTATGASIADHSGLTHSGASIGDHSGLTHDGSVASHPDLTHVALSHPALTVAHPDHSIPSATHTHASGADVSIVSAQIASALGSRPSLTHGHASALASRPSMAVASTAIASGADISVPSAIIPSQAIASGADVSVPSQAIASGVDISIASYTGASSTGASATGASVAGVSNYATAATAQSGLQSIASHTHASHTHASHTHAAQTASRPSLAVVSAAASRPSLAVASVADPSGIGSRPSLAVASQALASGADVSVASMSGSEASGADVSVPSAAIASSLGSRPSLTGSEASFTATHADHSLASLSHQDIGTHGSLTHAFTPPAAHGSAGTVTHSFTEPSAHTISSHSTVPIVPAYYALAYIQRCA